MSDHGHHDDPGGHELEAINTKMLFRLVVSLSLVTLLASMAVVQWFYSQRRELQNRYAAEGSFQLQDYQAKMAEDLTGLDAVAAEVASTPGKLAAAPAYPGWVNPDPAATAAAAAVVPAEPVPAPKPQPAVENDAPADEGAAEGADEGAEGDAPAKPEGAEGDAPAKPAKPEGAEGDAPAKPAKPAKPETPAEDKPAKPAKPAKPDGE